jgi:hypothetical protein
VSFQRPSEAAPQIVHSGSCIVERLSTRGVEAVKASRPAGSNLCTWTEARGQEALLLEPGKSRMYGARSDFTFQTGLHFFEDCAAISLVAQSNDGQQYRLFEGS